MTKSSRSEDPRRRLLIQALAAGAFTPVWLRGTAFAASSRTIHEIKGKVTVNGEPAKAGMTIAAGATLQTSANSQLIAILDKIAIILRAESEVVAGDQVADLRVIKGNLLAAGPDGPVTVQTNIASVTQHERQADEGVGFYVEVQTALTYYCTCYGVSQISLIANPSVVEVVQARHHDRPVNIYREGKIKNAKFKNHTDLELEMIGSLMGHKPPFMRG